MLKFILAASTLFGAGCNLGDGAKDEAGQGTSFHLNETTTTHTRFHANGRKVRRSFVTLAPANDPPPKAEPIAAPRERMVIPDDGYYDCTGSAGDSEYQCVVVIEKKASNAFVVRWISPTGTIIGIGRMDGERFHVGWAAPSGKLIGLTTYKRVVLVHQEDKKQRITWEGSQLIMPGDGELTPETLEFLRPLKKEKEKDK